MRYHIKNIKLASLGLKRIEWAEQQMDVLRLIRKRFIKEKPLAGVRISACLHITTETANLARTLAAGGAEVVLSASNPLSTRDEAAAAIVKYFKVPVFAIRGEDQKTYYKHLNRALDFKPQITMDDGADLVSLLHSKRKSLARNIWGGSEETTTGVIRLKSLERARALRFPIIAVNDAKTKYLFDNRYGTGQSAIDGIIRATNILLAGSKVVICGYGWCGKGLAMRAKGMGAEVVIIEVDPIRALEALMDGFEVMPMARAARIGDIFITVTGDINVIRKEHFLAMKDGAILANAGHFDVEINLPGLAKVTLKTKEARPLVEEHTLKNGRKIYLLAQGRLVNLASAEGHPASVMDMSFSNQALAVEYIIKNHKKLENKVYPMPQELDLKIAYLKLKSMGVKIDHLTPEQKKYLGSWQLGT
jgi:adenosylhomocysteinase